MCKCNNQDAQAQALEQIAFVPAPPITVPNNNDRVKADTMDSQSYLGMNDYFVQLAQARPRFPGGFPNSFAGQVSAKALPSDSEYRENAWIQGQYT